MCEERKINIPGRYDKVSEATGFAVQAAQDAGLDEKAIFHCQMAVDEAATNIIEHAYGGEDLGEIKLTALVCPGEFTITLMDNGRPFDPDEVPPPRIDPDPANMEPGGLGLHLMRSLMDEVTFSFDNGHNKLVMVKRQKTNNA